MWDEDLVCDGSEETGLESGCVSPDNPCPDTSWDWENLAIPANAGLDWSVRWTFALIGERQGMSIKNGPLPGHGNP